MVIELNETEARVLSQALDSYLLELAIEAARTDRQPDAHILWNMYRTLQSVREQLPDVAVPHAQPTG